MEFLDLLNPGIDLNSLKAGDSIVARMSVTAMNVDQPDIARIVVSLSGNNALNGYERRKERSSFTRRRRSATVRSLTERDRDSRQDRSRSALSTISRHYFMKFPTLIRRRTSIRERNSPVGVVWIALSKTQFRDPRHIGSRLDRHASSQRLRAAHELGCGRVVSPHHGGDPG